MLASVPSAQLKPNQPSGKETAISETGNGEDFSEHLGAKSAQTSDPEITVSAETIEPIIQPTFSIETLTADTDTPSEGEQGAATELELIPVQVQPEILAPLKLPNELRFTELEVTQPVGDGQMLMPSSEIEAEIPLAEVRLPAANQILNSGETKLFSAGSQPVVIGNGFVGDSKPFKEKSTKPVSPLPVSLQTSIAVKPNTGAQNLLAQPETPVQLNVSLAQERVATVDVDLEKAIGALELKTSTSKVAIDASPQKLSVDANVPSMSQPSQTLVRAIQENSNWTKVLSSSSVQFEQTPKIDGTVLQKLDIHLNLTALGKLDVKLRLQQGELQVQIRTDSEQAYKMLSADQDMLTNTIKGLGYKVDTIAISGPRTDGGFQMNSNSQSDSQQHSTEQHNHNEKSGQRSNREFMPMKDTDNDTPSPSSVVEDSVANTNFI